MTEGTLSQRDTVLVLLRQAGEGGVCGTRLLAMRIPRYAARVSELRVEGYEITTRTCRHPHHKHASRQIEYVLRPPTPHGTTPMF